MRRRRLWLLASIPLSLLWQAGCGGGGPDSPGPDTISPGSVVDLAAVSATAGSVTLAFTAPGDDDATGQAATYDLRYASFPNDPEAWLTWIQSPDGHLPQPAGQSEVIQVTGLEAGRVYLFRLRSADEAGNWSNPSNIVVATAAEQLDTTPPAAVPDLSFDASTHASVTVRWTAPGDDDVYGRAAAYALRYANSPIDDAGWDAATPVSDPALLSPQSPGSTEMITVTGLARDHRYYFALRTADEIPNWSALSNNLAASTQLHRTWLIKPDGSGDVATIRSACVDSAEMGDVVLLAPGHYTWSNQGDGNPTFGMIFFERNVTGFTVRGQAGPEQTILDAEGQHRVIMMIGNDPGSPDITFENLTLTGGDVSGFVGDAGFGGAMVTHLVSPTLRNCIFRGNRAVAGGGYAQAGVGHPRLENCIFEDNEADYGGGLFFVNSTETTHVVTCEIRHNRAGVAGAGVYADHNTLEMERCAIYDNIVDIHNADGKGGGIYVTELHPSRITNCTIAENSAGSFGGGIRVANATQLVIENSIIAFSTFGAAISIIGDGNVVQVGCCDLFGNVGGSGDALPPQAIDLGGVIHADPVFCGALRSWNYRLQASSPCLPGLECLLLGAFSAGCDGGP